MAEQHDSKGTMSIIEKGILSTPMQRIPLTEGITTPQMTAIPTENPSGEATPAAPSSPGSDA